MDVSAHIRDRLGATYPNRWGEDEISVHAHDALRDYARMTECFSRQTVLASDDGLLRLPDDAIRAVEVRNQDGDRPEFTAWRNMRREYGPMWFRLRVVGDYRETRHAVTDFDDWNTLRLVPKPPDGTPYSAVILTESGETDERIADIVGEYVLAMLLLRDGDGEAAAHYGSFLSMTGAVGSSTRLRGSVRGEAWF